MFGNKYSIEETDKEIIYTPSKEDIYIMDLKDAEKYVKCLFDDVQNHINGKLKEWTKEEGTGIIKKKANRKKFFIEPYASEDTELLKGALQNYESKFRGRRSKLDDSMGSDWAKLFSCGGTKIVSNRARDKASNLEHLKVRNYIKDRRIPTPEED